MKIWIKRFKPTSPGIRHFRGVVCSYENKYKLYKKLIKHQVTPSGRNNKGRITSWHKGGGHKRKYRIIDWKRDKQQIPAKVESIQYDPNRTSNIALLLYYDGERRYILSPKSLKINDIIESGDSVPISIGNCLPLESIPIGINIHCIELSPNKGAQIIRSAGCSAQILSKHGKYAFIKLKSNKIKKVPLSCKAVIGQLDRSENNLSKVGKAGRNRWRNIRPTVRGVAMNPIDHPMGGGEGKTSGGRHPCSPWGVINGTKTNRKKIT